MPDPAPGRSKAPRTTMAILPGEDVRAARTPRYPDREATRLKAERAAAAAVVSLGHFTQPGAAASRDAPAGWPSSLRDDRALARSQTAHTYHDRAMVAHARRDADEANLPAGLGRESERAPSHVLVARALGPVAGRAIVTERRAFLAQIDAAEQRVRELELQLQQEPQLLQLPFVP